MNQVCGGAPRGIRTAMSNAWVAGLPPTGAQLLRRRQPLPAPTSHGRAVSAQEIVDLYNVRFRMELTLDQQTELIRFLNSLEQQGGRSL